MESIRKVSVQKLLEKIEELIENNVEYVDITTLPLKNKIKFKPVREKQEIKEIEAA